MFSRSPTLVECYSVATATAASYKDTDYSQLYYVLVLSVMICMYVYMCALYAHRCKCTDNSRYCTYASAVSAGKARCSQRRFTEQGPSLQHIPYITATSPFIIETYSSNHCNMPLTSLWNASKIDFVSSWCKNAAQGPSR